MDISAAASGVWPQSSARCRLGWQHSGAGGVPYQSIRVAGEGIHREAGRTQNRWCVQEQPLPRALFS